MLTDVYHSSASAMAEYGPFFLVELVTVVKLVVSAPPRVQSAEPSTDLPTPAIISLSLHSYTED